MREHLGKDALETEWEKGKAMTQEEAVEYALAEESQPDTQPLSRREREIAELVVRGLTNRRICEELVISERTVETHLRNVFRKLGIGSRAEIAARLKERH